MATSVTTTQELFDEHQARLDLAWHAGEEGKDSAISPLISPDDKEIRLSLIGHLNLIQHHAIQLIGKKEAEYLHQLSENMYNNILGQLFSKKTSCVIVSDSLPVDDALATCADKNRIPLLTSPQSSHKIINHLAYILSAQFSERETLHGVFMEVMGSGIMINGESGIGKSELALELISRGHRLVADDAPEFSVISPDIISGSCPPILKDMLEVRGLGILNIRRMFGHAAIKQGKYLRLVIHLVKLTSEEMAKVDRLQEKKGALEILGVMIPMVTLPVAPGRNLAVMVEAAVKSHLLSIDGYDAITEFTERQEQQMQEN